MGIKTPPSYQHPSKRKRLDQRQEPQTSTRIERAPKPNKRKKGDALTRPAVTPTTSAELSVETVRVRVVAYDPLPGEINRFDDMINADIPVKGALLGLLRKSKDQIDSLVKLSPRDIEALTFEHGRIFVETNWALPAEKAEKLKRIFDPFGILTPRSMGAKIGAAVIVLDEGK